MYGYASGSANYYTAKLDADNGQTIWQRELPGAVNNLSEAGWLAAMDNGDVVMCNRTWSSSTSYDVVLHRYAGSNGATVWTNQWGSGGTTADDPRRLNLDVDGNLLVCGVSGGDYLVLKIDHTDGTPIWTTTYDGPPGWYDVSNFVTPGPHGSVLAAGFSDGVGTGWDIATIALDSNTGDQLWVERFDTGDSQSDEAMAIATSDLGSIYVVGYGYRNDTNNDMLVLHYHMDPASPVAELPARTDYLSAYPNPFNPRVMFSFAISQAGPVQLSIYDPRGQHITTLLDEIVSSGEQTATWDGRDDMGRPVSGGLYLARISSTNTVVCRKIVLAK